MSFLKLALLAAVFIFSAARAQASFLVEPYIKYSLGTFSITSTALNQTFEYDANAAGAGLRAGYTFSPQPIFLALDFTQSFGGKLKSKTAGVSDSDNGQETQVFAIIGGDFPTVHAWLGYAFINELSGDTNGVTSTYKGGDAIKAGFGFKVLPVLSINAEYVLSTYKKIKDSSGENDLSANGVKDAKAHALVLSVSAPLAF